LAIRQLAQRWLAFDAEAKLLESQMRRLLDELVRSLMAEARRVNTERREPRHGGRPKP
jgi:hypothetical protein